MIEKLNDVLKERIGAYLDSLKVNKDKLITFIDSLQPQILDQLNKAISGDQLAVDNLTFLEAQIAGKAAEIGLDIIDEEMIGLQQIILTGVGVAVKMLV